MGPPSETMPGYVTRLGLVSSGACISTIRSRCFVNSTCRRWDLGELDSNVMAEKNKAAGEAALSAANNRE